MEILWKLTFNYHVKSLIDLQTKIYVSRLNSLLSCSKCFSINIHSEHDHHFLKSCWASRSSVLLIILLLWVIILAQILRWHSETQKTIWQYTHHLKFFLAKGRLIWCSFFWLWYLWSISICHHVDSFSLNVILIKIHISKTYNVKHFIHNAGEPFKISCKLCSHFVSFSKKFHTNSRI